MRAYIFIPIGLIVIFIGYVLYMGLVKKNLKSKISTMVYPGLFFIGAWIMMYFLILK